MHRPSTRIPFERANLSGPDPFGNYTYKFSVPKSEELDKYQVRTDASLRVVEAGRDQTSIRFYLVDSKGKVVFGPQKIEDITVETAGDVVFTDDERREMRETFEKLQKNGVDPKQFGCKSWDEFWESYEESHP